MPIDYSSVPCTEINGSRSESYSVQGGIVGSSQVTLRVPFINTMALVSDILDNRRADPLHLGLFAHSASVAPAGGEGSGYTSDGQGLAADYNHVTITYGSVLGEGGQGGGSSVTPTTEIISESLEPAIEFQTLDHNNFEWAISGNEEWAVVEPEEAPGVPFFTMKLVRTWKNIVTPPIALLTLIGKTNNAPYTSQSLGLTFDTETLLYMQPTLNRAIYTGALPGRWNIVTPFLFKPQGHNKFRVTKEGMSEAQWAKLRIKGGGTFDVYPPANLAPVLGGI